MQNPQTVALLNGMSACLGTGGGWVSPATNLSNPYPNQGLACNKVTEAVDKFLCTGCSGKNPCLYRVGGGATSSGAADDPYTGTDAIEANDLSSTQQAKVAELQQRMEALEKTRWTPAPPAPNNGRTCDVARANGGFLAPWN